MLYGFMFLAACLYLTAIMSGRTTVLLPDILLFQFDSFFAL